MNTFESASPQVQSSIMTHRLYKENLNHFNTILSVLKNRFSDFMYKSVLPQHSF